MGYDVDVELAEAKAEAVVQATRESDPDARAALAELDETHWLCMHYLNAVHRRIFPRPRLVERAPGLASNPLAQPLAEAIDEIEGASNRGEDLSPRLSRSVDELRHHDGLLNDWGIHHLHLGPLGSGLGARAGRSGPLLFVFVLEDRMYFLDVLQHGRGHRPWIRRGLVETIHGNWPDAISRYRVDVAGIAHLKDDQVAIARSKNLSMFVQTKDGTVYAPLGGGYMSTGLSTRALTTADWFCQTIDGFQAWATQNAEAIRDAINQQRGIRLEELRIALVFHENGFAMIEAQSRSALQRA
jgi:hypothetical protein